MFFPLPRAGSICGYPSCSIVNNLGASFAATSTRQGLERALAHAERRETSGRVISLEDTLLEAEGGGGPGGAVLDGGGGGGEEGGGGEL